MPARALDRRRSLIACVLSLLLASCATVPYTGRRQLAIFSDAQQRELGARAYATMLGRSRVSSDRARQAMVTEVGRRIAAASDRPDWQWEFTLFDDPKQVNAWALPGGKVGVYTGILPIAEDETGLATIIGHEVAHVIARHGAERAGQSTVLGVVGAGVGIAASMGGLDAGSAMDLFGLGADVGVMLPFSRSQEAEADEIGLILMARAGYDPRAAVELWERMAAKGGGTGGPSFLSTHPSTGARIDHIRTVLPHALTYYQGDGGRAGRLPEVADSAASPAPERDLVAVMARLDRLALDRHGAEVVVFAIARELEVPPDSVVALLAQGEVTPGEGALALILARDTHRPVDRIVAAASAGGSWMALTRETGVDVAAVVARLERIAAAAADPHPKR